MSSANKKYLLPAIVVTVLLVAAGYVVMGLMNKDRVEAQNPSAASGVEAVAQASATDVAATPEDLQRILSEAKDANEKGQLLSPEGANAVELYLKALDIEPNNRLAKDALIELMPYAIDRADQYISEGNIPQADRALALLRKADPSSSVILTTLAGKIDNLRRVQASRDADQQTAILLQQQQAQQRAQEQAGAAAAANPEPPITTEATAASTPVPASAGTKPPRPAAAIPTPSSTPVVTPPPVVAAPATEDRNFQLTRKVEATYPQRALRQRIEGWVELSFTVTASGDVSEVKVVDSQPRREFDREATRALSQWKFKPRIENGKPVAASARQRLEFKLGS
jgi:periplasmic protein TonB